MITACKSSCCKHCGRGHHSLLHRFNEVENNTTEASENVNIAFNSDKSHVLLPTAVIQVVGLGGVTVPCRALFDTGAQANLITESCAKKLNLKQEHLNVKVSGNGGNVNFSNPSSFHFSVKSSKVSVNSKALVLPRLTGFLPNQTILKDDSWKKVRALEHGKSRIL